MRHAGAALAADLVEPGGQDGRDDEKAREGPCQQPEALAGEQQQQGVWQSHPYQGLKGKTLLLLGTGSIGQHIAHTGKHFGMRVLGISHSGNERAGFDQVYQLPTLNKML